MKPNLDTTNRKPYTTHNGLQWGSDPSFCFHGFSCPLGSWTEERLVQNLMRNNTHICTVINVDFDTTDPRPEESQADMVNLNGFELASFKSRQWHDRESVSTSMSPIEERTGIMQNHNMTFGGSPEKQVTRPHKKRKCVQGPDQKLCHCQSEKRRREIISQRYRDLCQVVPGLGNKLYTRRYILVETVRWIMRLLEENDALRQQRDRLNASAESR